MNVLVINLKKTLKNNERIDAMTVQTSYKIVPSFAFHGQVTDIGTQKTIITAPAEGDIGVGLGVCIWLILLALNFLRSVLMFLSG